MPIPKLKQNKERRQRLLECAIDKFLKQFEDKLIEFYIRNIEYGIKKGGFNNVSVPPVAHAILAVEKFLLYKWIVLKDITNKEMVEMVVSFPIIYRRRREKMKYCILMGSPRKNGNTSILLKPFIEEIGLNQDQFDLFWLHDKHIEPCIACRNCQKDWTTFGCRHNDDVQEIFDKIYACDVIVLATPIYSWYCTPPMKAILDRLMYGMNKYYGDEKGPSLWAGRKLAIITTCGYKPEKGADLFEEGIKRYCKHSELEYFGMLAERDLGYKSFFISDDKIERARLFVGKLSGKESSAI